MIRAMAARAADLPLATRLAALTIALAVLPLSVVTVVNDSSARALLTDNARRQSLQVAGIVARDLDQFLDVRLKEVTLLAVSPGTLTFMADPANPALYAARRTQLDSARDIFGYQALYFASSQGIVLVASDDRLAGQAYSTAVWFRSAVAGRTAFDEPRYDPVDARVYLHASAPIRSERGVILGAVVGRVGLETLDEVIDSNRDVIGRDSYGALWDDAGVQLSHNGVLGPRFQPLAPVSASAAQEIRAEAQFGPDTSAMIARSGGLSQLMALSSQLLYDARDPATLSVDLPSVGAVNVAVAPLIRKRWLFGVFTPASAVVDDLNRQTSQALGMALAAAILSAGAGVAAARWVTRPIRAVDDAAQAIAGGDLSRRVGLRRGDEAGRLAAAFDRMADSLAAKQAELMRHAETLEETVRRRNAALVASEALYRNLYEAVPLGVVRGGMDGRAIQLNPAAAAMLGYATTEEALTSITNLAEQVYVNPEQRRDLVGRALASDTWVNAPRVSLRRPDGAIIVANITMRKLADPNGAIAGVEALLQDVTERTRAEDAVRYQATLLEQVSDAVISTDLQEKIVTWNQAAEALYGWQPEEVAGRQLTDVLQVAFADASREEMLASFGAQGHWRGEAQHRRRDGSAIFVLASVTLVRDAAGQPVGMVSANRDITDRKTAELAIQLLNAQLEQRVQERTAQLEQANAELEAFSYSISHDLRAPLRGIDGWSQALLEDYGRILDTQAKGYLDRVRAESQRMGHLIDDILRLSRVSRAELHRQTVDLSAMVEGIAERLRQAERLHDVEVVIEPGLTADCDARLMEIALENLLANAWKFTGQCQTARVEFGREVTDKGIAFFVRDNGAGFDMTYAQRLFAPFQRLHAPEEFSGSGIGLAIVARVIRRHAGSIWPEAVPGQGATFYFVI